MGILSELEEIKSIWSRSSAPVRTILAVSAFFTVTSVTSLSDAIFHWKGFILNGVTFYREWFSGPIREVALDLGIVLVPEAIDIVIVYAIWFIAIIRKNIVGGAKRYAFFLTIYYSLILALLIHAASGELEGSGVLSIISCVILVLYFLYPRLYRSFTPQQKFAYYFPMMVSVAVILVLGAINAGLQRAA